MRSTTTALVLVLFASLAAPSFAEQVTSMAAPVVAVDNPQQLVSLNVVSLSGTPIGDVVKVKTGSDGRASRVMVMLSTPDGMGRVAAMRPERLFFDRRALVLVAQYSPAQLTQLALTATTPSGVETGRSSGMVQRAGPTGLNSPSDVSTPGAPLLPMGR